MRCCGRANDDGREVNRDGSVGKPHDVTLLNMSNYTPPSRHQGQSPQRYQDDERPTKKSLRSWRSC